MKQLLACFALALSVSACSSLLPRYETEFDLTIKSVELPASIAAEAPLNVVAEVEVGGCTKFKRFEVVSRTASTLKLRAIGSQTEGKGIACPAYVGWKKEVYTDSATPARTHPFEVIINGISWGKVPVKSVKTVATPFKEVLFPRGITPSAPLSITGRYVNNCMATAAQWRVVSRTPHQLKLESTQDVTYDPSIACTAVYNLDHVVYVDQSTVERLDPFEIVVNGQSWGRVAVADTVPADLTESVADLQNSFLPPSAAANEALHLNLGSPQQPTACTKYRFDVNRTASSLDLKVIQRQTETCAEPDSIGTVYYLDPPTPTRTTPFTVTKNGQPWGTIEIK